jgi:hypothetical protein
LSAPTRAPSRNRICSSSPLAEWHSLAHEHEGHEEPGEPSRASPRTVSPRARLPVLSPRRPGVCRLNRRSERAFRLKFQRRRPTNQIVALTQSARNCSNVSAFADKIDYGPMLIALLQMCELRIGQFAAPESAAKADGENCPVPFTLERLRVRCRPKSAGFGGREPVSASSWLLSNSDARCQPPG